MASKRGGGGRGGKKWEKEWGVVAGKGRGEV
jgi:hypothetical protein